MDSLLIESGTNTPMLHFSPDSGILVFRGKSIPENTLKFYTPVKAWVTEYLQQPASETVLDVYLEYFNTSSAKMLIELFKQVQDAHLAGRTAMRMVWRYETADLDMLEAGEDMKNLLKVEVELVAVDE